MLCSKILKMRTQAIWILLPILRCEAAKGLAWRLVLVELVLWRWLVALGRRGSCASWLRTHRARSFPESMLSLTSVTNLFLSRLEHGTPANSSSLTLVGGSLLLRKLRCWYRCHHEFFSSSFRKSFQSSAKSGRDTTSESILLPMVLLQSVTRSTS